MIKLHTDKRTVVVFSGYAPQQGLTNNEKDRFYENIIPLIARINEKDIIIGGYFNGHVRKDIDGYDGVHGGYGFGVRNTERECIPEMGAPLDIIVCNTWFKIRDSRIITYSSSDCSTQIDCMLVSNKDRKLVKDVKVISIEEVVSQHCIVVSDVKIKPCKEEKQPFIPKRKVWKLN